MRRLRLAVAAQRVAATAAFEPPNADAVSNAVHFVCYAALPCERVARSHARDDCRLPRGLPRKIEAACQKTSGVVAVDSCDGGADWFGGGTSAGLSLGGQSWRQRH